LLNNVGINPERMYLGWISSSEAARFSEVVQGFADKVRQLGPLETKQGT
jgi:coenzyme F420-reducing hydrogenase delta subunit